MWVSKLELLNVKSFKGGHALDFGKKINLLVGPNNSGKSTIINSILYLQSSNSQIISHGEDNLLTRIFFDDINPRYLFRTAELLNDPEIVQKFKYFQHSNRNGVGIRSELVFDASIPKNQTLFHTIPDSEPNNFIYPYLSKRKVLQYEEAVNSDATNSVRGNFTNLFAKVDRLSTPEVPAHNLYKKACLDIIGFPINTMSAGRGKEAALVIGNFERISLRNMGEGVPNLLGLIVDLCVAENKLFLIEEPENDIHPKALKALCNLILEMSEKNQFIISTHSNIVTKCLGIDPETKIFKVSMGFDSEIRNLPVSSVTEMPNTREARIAVLEDLGYEFNDYELWKAWLFLEESSAEELVRDYFIDWFAPNLKLKLRTYSSGSLEKVKDRFSNFNNLFVFIHLESTYKDKAWVIVDGGTGEEEKIINELKAIYAGKHGWNPDRFKQFSEHDFEKYYPEEFSEKVNKALSLKDNEKRKAKAAMLKELKVWIAEDEKRAKKAFQKSAAEVIELLKKIEKEIA